MNIILIIYIITFIIVMSILTLDRYISYKPKTKFGKWWRKHIIDKDEKHD